MVLAEKTVIPIFVANWSKLKKKKEKKTPKNKNNNIIILSHKADFGIYTNVFDIKELIESVKSTYNTSYKGVPTFFMLWSEFFAF